MPSTPRSGRTISNASRARPTSRPTGALHLRAAAGRRFLAAGRYRAITWINNDQLDPHLSFLVATLALPRPDLGALLRERSLKSRVFCYWENDKGDRVPDVRPEYLDIFRTCEIAFEIDEYPQQIIILEGGKTYKAWI